jgi:scyllo-inositol 2-dehydrogenase (NADP+)
MAVNVGIIGYGLAGSVFHAPLVQAVPRLALAAVATSRPIADPGVRRIDDPLALIADPHIDLVVIASPNLSHFPLASAALEAGKHVVVDKPFTVTPGEADALIALAAERRRLLTVFHNRRWDGDYLTVRKALDEGRIGEATLFEAHWDRFRADIKQGWREVPADGAGLLNDLGPHLIDQALQLFGRPAWLYADVLNQRADALVDDYFDLTFGYDRLRVRLCASTLAAAPRPRFAVHGSRGSLVKYGIDPQEDMLKAGRRPGDAGFGEDDPAMFARLTSPDGASEAIPTITGCYPLFYEAIADSIIDGAPPPVDPRDACDGLKIVQYARQSAREGRRINLADAE